MRRPPDQSPQGFQLRPLSRRAREFISRSTLLLIGLTMGYFSVRGLQFMASSPASTFVNASTGRSQVEVVVLPWVILLGLGLVGGSATAAAVLPVKVMQAIFERWYKPPITGDRGLEPTRFGWGHTWWWW